MNIDTFKSSNASKYEDEPLDQIPVSKSQTSAETRLRGFECRLAHLGLLLSSYREACLPSIFIVIRQVSCLANRIFFHISTIYIS